MDYLRRVNVISITFLVLGYSLESLHLVHILCYTFDVRRGQRERLLQFFRRFLHRSNVQQQYSVSLLLLRS